MKRPLIINFKNYTEISGNKTVKLAKAAYAAAKKLKVEIVVAPPQLALADVTKNVRVPVICQHVDDEKMGLSTGYVLPEIARSYGAIGSLINHSEHRIEMKHVASLVDRLRALHMTSIVCAREPWEVLEISVFKPDFIAIEPPELIGTGRAVSKENPAIITKSIEAAGSRSRIICGAGITNKEDVAKAMELGSHGILVASGVIKASSWAGKIAELAVAMR